MPDTLLKIWQVLTINKRVITAVSGGVDSSVAAYLLKAEGYEVLGATLRLFKAGEEHGCCSQQDIEDAEKVCREMDIPHRVISYRESFIENVVKPFSESYIRGETPNPCIVCNRRVKFKCMYDLCVEEGYDKLATGHYARVRYDSGSDRWLLLKGLDGGKDQSYVLYDLTQEMLGRTLFPVGELSKAQVREIAEVQSFINSSKPDSQDICFIPDGDYGSFIQSFTGYENREGDFVDVDGKVLGRHRGIIRYTTGQRRGLGVSADRPLYVVRKDMENNRVILGDEKDLHSARVMVRDVNLIALSKLEQPIRVEAKIRYSQKTALAMLHPIEDGKALLEFDEPQRAPTPGQSAVFYDGETVIGGGVIC